MDDDTRAHRLDRVRRFYEEAYTEGDYTVIDELFAPEFSGNRRLPGTSDTPGPEIVRGETDAIRTAFPDFRPEIKKLYTDGDTVIAHLDVTASHDGPLVFEDDPPFVVEPTGRPITFEGLRIYRFGDDDTVVESWAWAPWIGILLQLGAAGAYERYLDEVEGDGS